MFVMSDICDLLRRSDLASIVLRDAMLGRRNPLPEVDRWSL